MRRRALLLAAWPAMASGQEGLVPRGRATRTWSPLRIAVYDAALHVAPALARAPAPAILDAAAPWRVALRYHRAVPRADALAAWGASLAPLHPAFAAWVADIRPGDEEAYAGEGGGLALEGPRRPRATVAQPGFARLVLAAFIGPDAPGELRRGLVPD